MSTESAAPPLDALRLLAGALVLLTFAATASPARAGPTTLPATSPTSATSPIPAAASMAGKVFVGYQGWFAPAVEGTKAKWVHYGNGNKFEPGTSAVEMWPDTTGFDPDELVPTAFRHADGRVANVFDSANPKTIARHFGWMRDHGIDGAFVQRFGVTAKNPPFRDRMDAVLAGVRAAAAAAGRSYAVMYDLSGMKQDEVNAVLRPDWRRLVDELRVTADPTYLRHRGKPVVAVWGVGFNDGRKYDLAACADLVRYLKKEGAAGGGGGVSVMLGVPYWWRGLHRDAVADPALLSLLAEADVISPWAVGRYGTPEEAARRGTEVVKPDLAWAKEHHVDYLPVAFPGFGWSNLQKLRKQPPGKGIDRLGGRFFWSQAVAAKRAGADMLYVAMFDEIDEGTAILPVTNDPPVGATTFKTYDGLPGDHYLWLAGEAGKVMRGQRPAEPAMP
ncbi:MAG: Xylosidase/arabinosidase, partial [Phycisphaerales bacterium]|nr:Xylosidase/arabinosidase [Phycisphaerales bacterium]